MRKIFHQIKANLQSSTCDYAPIDIHQYDANHHVLLIQLCNNRRDFISVNEDTKVEIEFYLNDTLIESKGATIADYDKGLISYVISKDIVKNYGRYVVKLILVLDGAQVSVSFLMTVAKSHDFDPSSHEVIMTKEFYDTLTSHLKDFSVHLKEEDRDFLDTFSDKIDDLTDLLKIGIHVDEELTDESENPVEGRVIKRYVDNLMAGISTEVGNIIDTIVGRPPEDESIGE